MRVIFERVDERRYRIGAIRDGRHDVGAEVVPMRPAPGSAAHPHDPIHFVVEEVVGLRLGIYGQLAAGGDVNGFFRPRPEDRSPAREKKRSLRVGRAGRADVGTSERIASLVDSEGRLDPKAGGDALEPGLRRDLARKLEETLRRWNETSSGERLVLNWPDRLTLRRGRIPGC